MQWLLVALALGGCGDASPEPAETPSDSGPRVRMDFARRGGLYDAPFPSDDLRVDGVIDLSGYPNPDAMPYVTSVLDVLADADGFGTTMGTFFSLDGPVDVALGPWDTVQPESPVFLVPLDAPGDRVPVDVRFTERGGPFGASNQVSLLPVQGVPLRPRTTYAAVLLRELGLGPLPDALPPDYEAAIEQIGVPRAEVAGLAVFTTWDPVEEQQQATEAARAHAPRPPVPVFAEDHGAFCVYEATVEMPVYQEGEPPYESGGGWVFDGDAPSLQRMATSRFWVTVPRGPTPPDGWPVVVMVRTGGGGDRPLIDRGPRAEAGGEPIAEGTGPALELAAAGFAGVMVDGPHGGPRNPTGGDEQFLMFNVTNPVATRDNVRQSALELALLPDVIAGLSFDTADCDGQTFAADPDHLALLGHSMGATIAPLVLATEPRFGALLLSGAGGSYIHNIVYKQSPVTVRPLAEAMLNYPARGLTLGEHDPFLSLLQWAAEPADPPVYAPHVDAHVLMAQGIVDTYILPPMANATSLSLGLDLGGPALDAQHPDLADMVPLTDLLPLVDREQVDLPARGADRTGVVVQYPQDTVEDGHEVLFQTEAPKHAVRCFLESWRDDGVPTVIAGGGAADPCP